jgi:glycosyltransferase involved in cell wall biosynthesis
MIRVYMNKKRVLMTLSEYNAFGGHSSTITNLCLGLNDLGYDTTIGAFKFNQNPPEGINMVILDKFKFLPKDKKFDIIHNHHTKLNFYSLIVKEPFIFHLHGAANKTQVINLKISLLLCKHRISRVIAISNSVMYQANPVKKSLPIDIVYCGVDSKRYNPDLPSPYTIGKPQLLFVGVLYPHKNVTELIKMIKKLKSKYPEINLQIVGDGEDYDNLKQKIKEFDLSDNIQLLGKISSEELILRYSSCDIYVTASKHEMLDIPVIEAMSCGKPVVISNLDAHLELIEQSKAGLTFSLEKIHELPEKIIEVYENIEIYKKKGREFAIENDWSKISQKIAKIYDEEFRKDNRK